MVINIINLVVFVDIILVKIIQFMSVVGKIMLVATGENVLGVQHKLNLHLLHILMMKCITLILMTLNIVGREIVIFVVGWSKELQVIII